MNANNSTIDNSTSQPLQEDRDLFAQAIREAVMHKTDEELAELDKIEVEDRPPSRRHKIRMNRLFRERVGSKTFLPFPEVDSAYERLRSKIVIKLKINEYLDKKKQRRS